MVTGEKNQIGRKGVEKIREPLKLKKSRIGNSGVPGTRDGDLKGEDPLEWSVCPRVAQ